MDPSERFARWMLPSLLVGAVFVLPAGSLYVLQERFPLFASTLLVTGVLCVLGTVALRLRYIWLAPSAIVASIFVATGVIGAPFHHRTRGGLSGVSAYLELDPQTTAHTLLIFMSAGALVLLGGLMPVLFTPARRGARLVIDVPRVAQPSVLVVLIVYAISLSLLFAGMDDGVGALLRRDTYLPLAGNRLSGLGLFGAMIVVAFCGAGVTKPGTIRWVCILLLGSLFLVAFSLSSRRLAITPLLFAVGFFAATPDRRQLTLVLPIAGVLTLLLLDVVLVTRGLPEHGLLPYLSELARGELGQADLGLADLANNLLFSFPLVGETAFNQPDLAHGDFWISVNPLPGFMTDWYAIEPHHRLNAYTPYSGLGELWNYGGAYMVLYLVGLGCLLSATSRPVHAAGLVGLLIVVASAGLISVSFLQYNLRTVTRLTYYAVIISTVYVVAMRTAWSARARSRAMRARRT